MAGFTLVETLVALAVAAISLAAIASLSNATLRSDVHVERHLAEVETAQLIIVGLPDRDELRDGVSSGEMAGHSWNLDIEPFRTNFIVAGAARWTPKMLILTVQSPSGARLTIDMIRLVRPRAP